MDFSDNLEYVFSPAEANDVFCSALLEPVNIYSSVHFESTDVLSSFQKQLVSILYVYSNDVCCLMPSIRLLSLVERI